MPTSPFYALLGGVGVSLFFMITGYLFWSRLLASFDRIDWTSLYIGRVFRVAPLYLTAASIAIFLAFSRSNWHLEGSGLDFVVNAFQWLALGLYGQPIVNGHNVGLMLAGVTWTIYYEWLFYFALPALAVVAACRSHLALIVTAIWLVPRLPGVLPEPERYLVCLFLCGMLTASLHKKLPKLNLISPIYSVLAITLLVALFTNVDGAYNWTAIALMAPFFFLVASGTSVFGLLTLRPARRLGNISYSVYLLHGLTLSVASQTKQIRDFATGSVEHFWITAFGLTVIVVVISSIAYIAIENPGIALGKHLARRVKFQAWKSENSNPVQAERHQAP